MNKIYPVTLNKERSYIDAAITAAQLGDMQGALNALYEMLLHKPAPGSSKQMHPGHVHDNNGHGRGLARGVNGRFFLYPDPAAGYMHAKAYENSPRSFAHENSSVYVAEGASNYVMGVCYVSPGIEAIRCDVVAWSTVYVDPPSRFRIVNLSHPGIAGNPSNWTEIIHSPVRYFGPDTTVAVSPSNGKLTRVMLDIEVEAREPGVGWVICAIGDAFPYEYTDAPIL